MPMEFPPYQFNYFGPSGRPHQPPPYFGADDLPQQPNYFAPTATAPLSGSPSEFAQIKARYARIRAANSSQRSWFVTADQRARWAREDRRLRQDDAEELEAARFRSEGRFFTPEDNSTYHAGFGTFALVRTLIGIIWTTSRSISIFVLLVKIMTGSNDTYPGAISIVILFTSAQTYLGTRAMPRILYIIIVLDLLMIFGAIGLTTYGLFGLWGGNGQSYEKLGVTGGNCPCLFGFGSNNVTCASYSSPQLGCDPTLVTSTATNYTYPPSCDLDNGVETSGGPADPSHGGTKYLLKMQVSVGCGGVLYGATILWFSRFWIWYAIRRPREILRPLPSNEKRKMGRRSYKTSVLAFTVLCLLALVTLVAHIVDETKAQDLYYIDSAGPLGGSDVQSWSDCFTVPTPVKANGHFSQWWKIKEGRILRVIAGV